MFLILKLAFNLDLKVSLRGGGGGRGGWLGGFWLLMISAHAAQSFKCGVYITASLENIQIWVVAPPSFNANSSSPSLQSLPGVSSSSHQFSFKHFCGRCGAAFVVVFVLHMW